MNRSMAMLFLVTVIVVIIAALGMIFVDFTETGVVSKVIISSGSSDMNGEAVRLLEEGKAEEAVDILRDARQREPNDPVIARNLSLGLARVAQKEDGALPEEEKVAILQEALDVWPENPEAMSVMSTIHHRNGRYRQAWVLAVRMAALYPDQHDLTDYIAHLEAFLQESEGLVSEEGQYFRILYSGDRQLEFGGELLVHLQAQMDSLTAAMGYFPKGTIDVLIMTEDLGERAEPMDPLLQGLYDGKIRLYLKGNSPEGDVFIKTVRHEMVHAILHRAGGVLPGWFQEGLAQKIGGTPTTEQSAAMRNYLVRRLNTGQTVGVAGLQGSFVNLPNEERTAAYAASYTFVDFLVQMYGENLIPVLVTELEGGQSLEQLLKSLTGKDLISLETDFVQDLKRGG